MKVTTMRSDFASTAWRSAFASELIRLQPAMNPDAADEVSDAMYLRCPKLSASDAARLYVEGDSLLSGEAKTA